MKVFDVATGELLRTFEGHTHHVLSVCLASRRSCPGHGRRRQSRQAVERRSTVRRFARFRGLAKRSLRVQFAGAEDHFFAACGDQNLYRCDMGGERKSISTGQDFLYVVSTSLLGKSVAFGGHDSIVRVVDDNGGQLAELKPSGRSVTMGYKATPRIFSGSEAGEVRRGGSAGSPGPFLGAPQGERHQQDDQHQPERVFRRVARG